MTARYLRRGLIIALLALAAAWSAPADAAPNWIIGTRFLELNRVVPSVVITGELTYGPFNFGGHQTTFKCPTSLTETLIGGSSTVPGTDEITRATRGACTVLKPALCTITRMNGPALQQTTLKTIAGKIYHEVKNLELREVQFGGGVNCPLNNNSYRGASRNYTYKAINVAGGRVGLQMLEGEEDEFINEELEAESSKGEVAGSEEMEAPEKQTLEVKEETEAEEKEQTEAEEKEAKENEEKEGNPTILPAPTPASPLKFTESGGKLAVEVSSKSKIQCKESSGSGSFTGARVGTLTIELHSCTFVGLPCQSLGGKSGAISISGSIELVDVVKAKLLTLGLEIAPQQLHVECPSIGSLFLMRGAIISEVSGIESGGKTGSVTGTLKQEKGKQAIRECHLTKSFCEGSKFVWEASLNGSAFEEAGVEGEVKVTLGKEAVFDF